MAFEKLLSFTKDVSDLSNQPALDPVALKAQFDAAPDEVRQYLNKLIDALKLTTDSDSGADNIGATNITGLTGSTVQSLLESLKTLVDTVTNKLPVAGEISTFSVAAGATVDKVITYPDGKFTVKPNLVYSFSASDILPLYTLDHGIIANTKDSATIRLTNKGTATAFVIVYWQAKE